ncbi:MAG: uroporphyrinogen decarboxylase family protein [Phycisphaerae bacterium]|jgi:uroporphyrinogen decarboxylase
MSSRQLVKAALAHQQTDRVPYCIEFTEGAGKLLQPFLDGKTLPQFIGNDVLCIWPPWWGWHELAADWRQLDRPCSPERIVGWGSYGEFKDSIAAARQDYDPYVLAIIYGSHFEKANAARGIENFLADMAGDSDWAKQFLQRIIDRNMAMLENILAIKDIDGVLLGSDWGTQTDLILSPAMWEDMIAPGEQREYDLVHAYGKDVWLHSCGKIEKVIPRLIDMGLNVLNPVQPEAMDIASLKARFGEKLTFWGGVSTQRTLPFGTSEQVKAEARAVREMMSRGGGYVFAPAQAIQEDVPVANMLALLEVAKEGRPPR